MKTWLMTVAVLLTTVGAARAQTDSAPPPPPADGTSTLPPDATPQPPADFVPYVAPADPAPPPAAATPAALPPGVTSTELPTPAPAYSEAPVAARPARTSSDCRGGNGKSKGFFRGAIPAWAGGAVVGGAVGALAFSIVGLLVAAALNYAILKTWINAPPGNVPGVFALPLVALPLGALAGAVVGGLVTPFLPNIPLTRPCLDEPGSDPTRRPSGVTGGPGSGTAG